MFSTDSNSQKHANSVLLLSHITSGMGERSLAIKMKQAFENVGCHVEPIMDILDLMGDKYESFAKLNYDLADVDMSVIEDLKTDITVPSSEILLILSWCFSLAALYATGIHKSRPTIAKLYAHHPNERILAKLYEPADLLITESLLANDRAYHYGIDPARVLYLPHCYPSECETLKPSNLYSETLGTKTKIIGCVSRLEYGKNCEFAVEAVRQLVEKGHDVALVLKGDFPDESPYPDYQPRFSEMLEAYSQEPWLLWDRSYTPFPQVLQEYASFDVLLHPSGAEGGSHVIVECLGLQKPVVLLDCSTNPYLFKDLATFVKTSGEIKPAQLPFYQPDLEDLVKTLEKELKLPDKARVEERFHERVLEERIPLLFERNPDTIKDLYVHDRKLYSL